MRITVFAVGRMKSGPERELADRYFDRLKKTGSPLGLEFSSVTEITESRAQQPDLRKQEESAKVLEALDQGGVLVLLDERDSFCWTRPYDVSWKDLASGKVKLINDPIIYMNAKGEVRSLEETPQTPEEWRDFCGPAD